MKFHLGGDNKILFVQFCAFENSRNCLDTPTQQLARKIGIPVKKFKTISRYFIKKKFKQFQGISFKKKIALKYIVS